MIHCVFLLFPGKEDLPNKWTRPLRREGSTSVKHFAYTHSASLVCLSRFITNFPCTFVTQETQGSLFRACHPPSPQKVQLCFCVGRTCSVYVRSYTRTQFRFSLSLSFGVLLRKHNNGRRDLFPVFFTEIMTPVNQNQVNTTEPLKGGKKAVRLLRSSI